MCFLVCLGVVVFAPSLGFASGQTDKASLNKEYFEIAEAYADLEKYDKAIDFYKRLKDDAEFSNAANYNLARMYGLKGEWENSVPLLKALHEKEPTNALILKAYGYSLVCVGKMAEGTAIYKSLAENDSENPQAQLDYIVLLVFAKQNETAKAVLKKAIEDFPTATQRSEFERLLKQLENPEQHENLNTN